MLLPLLRRFQVKDKRPKKLENKELEDNEETNPEEITETTTTETETSTDKVDKVQALEGRTEEKVNKKVDREDNTMKRENKDLITNPRKEIYQERRNLNPTHLWKEKSPPETSKRSKSESSRKMDSPLSESQSPNPKNKKNGINILMERKHPITTRKKLIDLSIHKYNPSKYLTVFPLCT